MHAFVGHCRTCGYPLVRLPEPRCPECGTTFNPDDPRTMDFLPSRTVAFLKKKSSFWTLFAAFLAIGASLASATSPFAYLTFALTILAFFFILATLYILMARHRFQSYLRSRLPPSEPPARKTSAR